MKLLLVLAAILVLGKAEWNDAQAGSDAALKTVEQREERLLSLLLNKVVQHLRGDLGASGCLEPRKQGPCRAYIPRVFFNQQTGQCEDFGWGGCQANGNNFQSMGECQETCKDVRLQPQSGSDKSDDLDGSRCLVPKQKVQCYGYFPRFFFNQQTGQCEYFIWGGCRANGNNFKTKEECQKTCGVKSQPPPRSLGASGCLEPRKPGPCLAYLPRVFFNQQTGQCEDFVWGGCEANGNNFETFADCVRTCLAYRRQY